MLKGPSRYVSDSSQPTQESTWETHHLWVDVLQARLVKTVKVQWRAAALIGSDRRFSLLALQWGRGFTMDQKWLNLRTNKGNCKAPNTEMRR